MQTNYRRIALLTGVSAAALGLPAVAQAATTVEPSNLYLNIAGTVNDTVNICLDNPPNPDVGVDCLYGVVATGTGVVTAAVTAPANGEIDIVGIALTSDVNLTVVNNNPATVQAFAVAFGGGGFGTANAIVDNGLNVTGSAADDAIVGIDNQTGGVLNIDADAWAFGGTTTWGLANANVDGILEIAIGGGTTGIAVANLDNDGIIDIDALALATGTGAIANASVDFGIVQIAVGDTIAVAGATNDGIIDINANATAIDTFAGGVAASANATADGHLQLAVADTIAVAAYDNNGTLDVDAIAIAIGPTMANANATVSYALAQIAIADSGGVAAANLDNDGAIDADAIAIANGGTFAQAFADVDDVVVQFALTTGTGGAAVADVNNSGLISGQALAIAVDAIATATVGSVIQQTAVGGLAVANVSNTALASITGSAVASAFAPAGTATANATIGVIIEQNAFGSTGAVASVANSGLISGLASANANAFVLADANASLAFGIDQEATVSGAATGTASALIGNSGSISFNAIANAGGTGTGTAFTAVSTAQASAFINTGINQNATATATTLANAVVGLANSGTIGIDATANASALFVASATAEVDDGIDQFASANATTGIANATASLSNSGNIGIGAVANASAGSVAFASASVDSGIEQDAVASGFTAANANVLLNNGGTLGINASANATAFGSASALAEVDTGIDQSAIVTSVFGATVANASVSLTNSGTLGIGAVANAAAGFTAFASASVDTGIEQLASATGFSTAIANVALTNSGTLGIGAVANASAGSTATAFATVDNGIDQNAVAIAPAFASASVSLVNSGLLGITASANALASGLAVATASLDTVIDQNAFASASIATASAALTNSGSLAIAANAFASALSTAVAVASVDTAIEQDATASGITAAGATVSLTNSGSIDIVANATAIATGILAPVSGTTLISGSAFASAQIDNGIDQDAFASAVNVTATGTIGTASGTILLTWGGTANAAATLTNTGSINIDANAFASGNIAVATASIDEAIEQDAVAVGGSGANATASLTNAAAATINLSADATALGTFGAFASATVDTGIDQSAAAFVESGTASANVNLTNAGVITVDADAFASANGTFLGTPVAGSAGAIAGVDTGIEQNAFASAFGTGAIVHTAGSGTFTVLAFGAANASVSLNNTGSIAVTADAGATGALAFAGAGVGAGIEQSAAAVAADSATASASLTNSATIDVSASAIAIGSVVASASAFVGTGIEQNAFASAVFGPANASVSLTNNGSIDVGASAFASGSIFAGAFAGVGQGIDQSAFATGASGTASALLVNSGDISVSADASATALSASAIALIGTGIQQGAFGLDVGFASLDNSGAIEITAEADAGNVATSTFAAALAFIGTGISQSATAFLSGGVATATITNTGSILIAADAVGALASDGSAIAVATIGLGIAQNASASSAANVALINNGTIDVLADASAIADEDATAVAGAGLVAFQSASAFGTGGDASVSIVNNGTLIGDADALAIGGNDVFASAFMGGLVQLGFGGTTGTADVSLVNDGLISITADAEGIGGGTGLGFAFASGGVQVAAAGSGAVASIDNNATMTVAADANIFVGNAAQKGANAVAVATALGWLQVAAAATTTATGTIVFGTAFPTTAVASDTLTGVAFVATNTLTNSPSGPALASFDNSGSLSVTAGASAVGDDLVFATAVASGLTQVAAGSSAVASFVNGPAGTATVGGTMTVAASAFASGDNAGSAVAIADAIDQSVTAAQFVSQTILAGFGTIHLTTGGGTVLLGVEASAQLIESFSATPVGRALAFVDNSGIIDVSATATAVVNGNQGPVTGATSPAFALALADGIDQFASGATASAVVDNSGSLAVAANAAASGVTAAGALAVATGISQVASAVAFNATNFFHLETVTATDIFGHTFTFQTFVLTDTAFASTNVGAASVVLTNSGSIDVDAVASAVAGTSATAGAFAAGVFQNAAGTVASASVSNSGDIDVLASAFASGTTGSASAGAIGIGQFLAGTTMNATFINSGVVAVEAVASGVASAFASATGYAAAGFGGGTLVMDVQNTGELLVFASAIDPTGTAVANAVGMDISNAPTVMGTALLGSPITGSITNAGTLDVVAFADGGFTVITGTAGVVTSPLGSANATGISILSGVNTMEVTNSGSIFVDAITTNGAPANATGIVVAANGTAVPLATDIFTFTNDGGTIIVRESMDGGATWQRGMAIDVAAAANNSVINLLDDGLIYGNIDVQAGDNIFVEDGVTVFDGIVNPECMPPAFDDPAVSGCGQGTLTIQNGGNLYLVDGNDDPTMDDGPSYVFVDTFNVADDGTIWFELNPTASGGTQPIGTYPQVFADVANLDGTLVADITLGTPLPADSYFWNNVIDANVRNGVFDQCVILGFPGAGVPDSLFLEGGCIYDAQANVDIGIERTSFDEIAGLTPNQLVVAGAIENVYAPTLTGPFGNLVLQLFNFEDSDVAAYADALDMLSGVEYPNYLHAVRNNTFVINSFVSDQIDCAIHIRGIDDCRVPETRGRVWVKGTYNSVDFDGDENIMGYDADSWSAMIGGDYQFGHAKLGAFVGYRDIDVDYPDAVVGSSVKADGLQVGLYGAYDVGTFYVRGIGSYSWLGGESERRIELFDVSGIAVGEPDVNVLSLYAEAGGRFDVGGSWVTPFIAIDHTSMDLQGFRETGGAGADLAIDDQTESQTSGLIGLKWAGNWGGIIPEAKIAYRHDFNGDLGVDMRFADAPAGSDFRKVEDYDDGSLIAGLSLAGAFGSNLMGRIGYQGRFNSDVTDHAFYGALTFLFGAPPPPPPPPPPAPPPPPPPATTTCPDGTVVLATEPCPAPPPPPPPPPPAPERG